MAFETVVIRSLRNGGTPVNGSYREDLLAGDLVTLSLIDTATGLPPAGVSTYDWEMIGRPEYSVAGGVGALPQQLGVGASVSFVVDADAGAVKKDGTYDVSVVINGGGSAARITIAAARTTGLTVPGTPAARPLRKLGGFESLEDTGSSPDDLGWATVMNRWLEAVRELLVGFGPAPPPAPTLFKTLTNGDGAGVVQGDLVACTVGNNTFRRTRNTSGFAFGAGIVGAVADAAIANAASGLVANSGPAPVRFEAGLALAAGDEVYLSTSTGFAINVPVAPFLAIGTVLSAAGYGGLAGDPALVDLQVSQPVPAGLTNVQCSEESEKAGGPVEIVISEYVRNFNLLDQRIGFLACTLSGLVQQDGLALQVGTYRVYVGGTVGGVDGALVATLTTTAMAFAAASVTGAPFATPVGPQLVKLTVAHSAAAQARIRGNEIVFKQA